MTELSGTQETIQDYEVSYDSCGTGLLHGQKQWQDQQRVLPVVGALVSDRLMTNNVLDFQIPTVIRTHGSTKRHKTHAITGQHTLGLQGLETKVILHVEMTCNLSPQLCQGDARHVHKETVLRSTCVLHSYYDPKSFLWLIVRYVHASLSLSLFVSGPSAIHKHS